jgi:Flp pilus assembly protein protease CpaA
MIFYFYIIIGILAIVSFFIILIKNRHQKREMYKKDAWMESLPSEEWGINEEDEKKDNL